MGTRTIRWGVPLAAVVAALAGCTAGNRGGPGADGGGTTHGDGSMVRPDTGRPPTDFDPFDPSNACGASTIPTERVPGSLLIVFDKSGSMSESSGGGTRWSRSVSAINNALTSMSDEMSAGLLLFPSGSSNCGVDSTPQVPVGPLTETRSMIASVLGSNSPGGGTPLYEATRRGYRILDGVSSRGRRGLIVVTDGGESCETEGSAAFLEQVRREHDDNGYLTYAVGLVISNNDLSTMAYNGGTPRSPTCDPICRAQSCYNDSECPTGTRCRSFSEGFSTPFPIPEPGECTCNTDADCPGTTTCDTVGEPCPFPIPEFCSTWPAPYDGCVDNGTSNCCHYDATSADFQREFEAALAEIGRRFLASCVFDLPRGTDPSTFDPALVNVGVTFEGESRTVLRRSSDDSVDSWNYTSGDHDSIVIQGPICDRLLMSAATVEIVLGCPTLLI